MSDHYVADPDVMHTDLGSEIILVHGRTGHSFRLNDTGRLAWLQLPTTPDALAQVLAEAFEVDAGTAQRDASDMLGLLASYGLAAKQP